MQYRFEPREHSSRLADFDTDGNGVLDAAEIDAMHRSHSRWARSRRGHSGDSGGGGAGFVETHGHERVGATSGRRTPRQDAAGLRQQGGGPRPAWSSRLGAAQGSALRAEGLTVEADRLAALVGRPDVVQLKSRLKAWSCVAPHLDRPLLPGPDACIPHCVCVRCRQVPRAEWPGPSKALWRLLPTLRQRPPLPVPHGRRVAHDGTQGGACLRAAGLQEGA